MTKTTRATTARSTRTTNASTARTASPVVVPPPSPISTRGAIAKRETLLNAAKSATAAVTTTPRTRNSTAPESSVPTTTTTTRVGRFAGVALPVRARTHSNQSPHRGSTASSGNGSSTSKGDRSSSNSSSSTKAVRGCKDASSTKNSHSSSIAGGAHATSASGTCGTTTTVAHHTSGALGGLGSASGVPAVSVVVVCAEGPTQLAHERFYQYILGVWVEFLEQILDVAVLTTWEGKTAVVTVHSTMTCSLLVKVWGERNAEHTLFFPPTRMSVDVHATTPTEFALLRSQGLSFAARLAFYRERFHPFLPSPQQKRIPLEVFVERTQWTEADEETYGPIEEFLVSMAFVSDCDVVVLDNDITGTNACPTTEGNHAGGNEGCEEGAGSCWLVRRSL